MASNWVIAEYQSRKRTPSLYGSIRICLKCWGKKDKWVRIPNYRAKIQTWNLPSMNQNFHPLDHEVRPLHLTEVITPYARVSQKLSFRAIWIRKFGTQTNSHYISGISRQAITVSFQRCSKILVVTNLKIFYFKLSLCSECCILSFGWFNGVWILCADVSEHPVSSIWTSMKMELTVFRNVGT
jgi:hypothetical protein